MPVPHRQGFCLQQQLGHGRQSALYLDSSRVPFSMLQILAGFGSCDVQCGEAYARRLVGHHIKRARIFPEGCCVQTVPGRMQISAARPKRCRKCAVRQSGTSMMPGSLVVVARPSAHFTNGRDGALMLGTPVTACGCHIARIS